MRGTYLWLSVFLAIGGGWSLQTALASPRQQTGATAVPRDRITATTGTASIKGRVVDATTGIPIRRATLQLSGAAVREPRATLTDSDGRYSFTELPAGGFTFSANKVGYVSLAYGQSRPAEPPRQLQLAAGQSVSDVNFSLPRSAVITGRVVDEFGEPVVDAMVAALRSQYINGTRRAVSSGRTATTNDLGEFRLFGISPGDIVISASLRNSMVQVAPDDRNGYAPTYYPGTPVMSQAQRLTLNTGQQITDLTIMLTPTRTLRVSGMAFDAQGVPLRQGFVNVLLRESTQFGVAGTQLRPDGTFSIPNLPPGDYQLSVNAGNPQAGMPVETATARVMVSAADVDNVRLEVLRPVSVSGRIIVEGGGQFPRGQPPRIQATPRELLMGVRQMPNEPVREDSTFTFQVYPGSSVIRVIGLPPGWLVRQMRLDGRDVSDGLDVARDVAGLEIELTSRAPDVTVAFTTPQGAAVTQAFVMAFSQDADVRERSTPGRQIMTRALEQEQGRARIRTLLPGSYYILALSQLDQTQWNDPQRLEALIPYAERIVLSDGDVKTITLTVSEPR